MTPMGQWFSVGGAVFRGPKENMGSTCGDGFLENQRMNWTTSFYIIKDRRLHAIVGAIQIRTAINLSQGFYMIPLDKEIQKICATAFPWGNPRTKWKDFREPQICEKDFRELPIGDKILGIPQTVRRF